ncbi:MAG: hypothetical protein LWW96_13765, partial [Acidovorax sp.]|nr:hypothetical protein [Acidovorax sp.]
MTEPVIASESLHPAPALAADVSAAALADGSAAATPAAEGDGDAAARPSQAPRRSGRDRRGG